MTYTDSEARARAAALEKDKALRPYLAEHMINVLRSGNTVYNRILLIADAATIYSCTVRDELTMRNPTTGEEVVRHSGE